MHIQENGVLGVEAIYRDTGYFIGRIEQYAKSLGYFDKALKLTPDDIRALVGRAYTRAKYFHYKGALEDISRVQSIEPDNYLTQAKKAFITYLCSEFEDALVQNRRYQRQELALIRMGIMQCTIAIENSIGEEAGHPLRDHFKIIRKMAWKRNYANQKHFEPSPTNQPKNKKKREFMKLPLSLELAEAVVPRKTKRRNSHASLEIKDSLHSIQADQEPILPYIHKVPFKPLQNYTSNISDYMAEKYLDKMYLDKKFVRKIKDDPGLYSPNKTGEAKLRQTLNTCYKAVACKQELLRTRRPFYSIKYQEARVSGALRNRQQLELEHQQRMAQREADSILNKMMKYYNEKRLHDFLATSEKLKRYCDNKPKKLLQDKATYNATICDTVCKAFYDLYRVNPHSSSFEQNKRIYATLGIPLSREPSTDSVIRELQIIIIDTRRQIVKFENRLKAATSPEEICWFYHELARLHLEQRHFELSRLYAKKCVHEASLIPDQRWILNSAMLMAKGNMQQHNKNDAKNNLLLAMKSAEKLNDQDKTVYLQKCQVVVDSIAFSDIFADKELKRREDMIINMMASTRMKEEVAHLFRQMSSMPTTRKMTVIPGIQGSSLKDKGSKVSKKMSIAPHSQDTLRATLEQLRRISKLSSRQSRTSTVKSLLEMNLLE